MCLVTRQQKPIQTRNTRTVYKMVNKASPLDVEVYSPFNRFSFLFNDLYETEFSFLTVGDSRRMGFDFRTGMAYGRRDSIKSNSSLNVIAKGFHSTKKLARLRISDRQSYVECTIPKGSLIYEDATGLVVSNKIIVNKLVEYKGIEL